MFTNIKINILIPMIIPSFNFVSIPDILFGLGSLCKVFDIIPNYGNNVLIVTGGSSLRESGRWDEIALNLDDRSINYSVVSVKGEPSPSIIDNYTSEYRDSKIDLVIGIGGGSVIDAAKAISAMIPKQDSVKNYLEGVGTKIHDGQKIPYIAIPTTSGTGSEATKNAVISEIGHNGFKKSLRHNNLVPNMAIIDPDLLISCPPSITAACGMDAFAQLLEAFVSSKPNPITNALAFSGIKFMKDNIILAYSEGASDLNVRAAMAYGALMSGITIANAGLGIIHGLASSIGGLYEIPHGAVCGTLLAEATKMNIKKLQQLGSAGEISLKKHALIGAILAGKEFVERGKIDQHCSDLINILEEWIEKLNIERLGKYGLTTDNIEDIINKAGLKNNPVELSKEDIKEILLNRI